MGFYLFNNTALGAAYLRERYGVSRIMIVDIDAHHFSMLKKVMAVQRKYWSVLGQQG